MDQHDDIYTMTLCSDISHMQMLTVPKWEPLILTIFMHACTRANQRHDKR